MKNVNRCCRTLISRGLDHSHCFFCLSVCTACGVERSGGRCLRCRWLLCAQGGSLRVDDMHSTDISTCGWGSLCFSETDSLPRAAEALTCYVKDQSAFSFRFSLRFVEELLSARQESYNIWQVKSFLIKIAHVFLEYLLSWAYSNGSEPPVYLGEYPAAAAAAAVCKPRQKIPVEDIPPVAMKKHSDQSTKQASAISMYLSLSLHLHSVMILSVHGALKRCKMKNADRNIV